MAKKSAGKSTRTDPATNPPRRTPTHRELASLIGQRAWWSLDELAISVNIVDARAAFGRVDVAITPIDGRGEKWVDLASITVEDATTTNHR